MDYLYMCLFKCDYLCVKTVLIYMQMSTQHLAFILSVVYAGGDK